MNDRTWIVMSTALVTAAVTPGSVVTAQSAYSSAPTIGTVSPTSRAAAGLSQPAIGHDKYHVPLQAAEIGPHMMPVRMARISPDMRQTSPWYEVGNPSPLSSCPPSTLAFDCFEPDGGMPGMPTDGLYGDDCGMGSSRWFFGSTYCNMYTVNDMELGSNSAGMQSERASFAWHWEVNGPGTSEQCYVAVFTAEDFDDTCSGPPASGYYSGIIWDFGILASSVGYYWFDSADLLCDTGLFHQLPLDGVGAYSMILGQAYNGTEITLATCAQPMLWGTKPANPGYQGPAQWDDDNPSDGMHSAPDECYDYAVALCPDPLGTMVCFYAPELPGPCLSLDVSNFSAGQMATFTVTGADPFAEVAVLYSLQPGAFQFEAIGWCVDFQLKLPPNPTSQIIGQGTANDLGVYQTSVPIPKAAAGMVVYAQAAQRYTCPDSCMSNRIAREVGTVLSFPYDGRDHVLSASLPSLDTPGFVFTMSDANPFPITVVAQDADLNDIPGSEVTLNPGEQTALAYYGASRYVGRMLLSEGNSADVEVVNAHDFEFEYTKLKCADDKTGKKLVVSGDIGVYKFSVIAAVGDTESECPVTISIKSNSKTMKSNISNGLGDPAAVQYRSDSETKMEVWIDCEMKDETPGCQATVKGDID
ncbi:MAG: hypothetical protein D8M59_06385 [Planctomycetes bacterium]|nr:hypothetical protein [Planctomycetota bacterium]NOG55126.1 hypothetical protein [Planctomycetota bacterium]